MPPAADVAVVQRLQRRRRPVGHMHAVGDRVDLVLRVHLPRDLAVLLGHAIDVVAVVEREVGHVEPAVEAELGDPLGVGVAVIGDQRGDQAQRELVVPGRHRGVRREYAQRAHRLGQLGRDAGQAAPAHLLVAQLDDQQRGMALVHVEAPQRVVAERTQHAHAGDAQHDLLAQAVGLVAAVEVVGDATVLVGVARHVGVEQQHRHHMAADADDLVPPGAHDHLAPGDAHAHARRGLDQCRLGAPRPGLLALLAVGVEPLAEIALAVHQRDRDHRHAAVGGRAHGVAGQHAQPAAVGRQRVGERDLHREIGDLRGGGHGGWAMRWRETDSTAAA